MFKKRKWTVFFLMKSVDAPPGYAIMLMQELRNIDFGDEISVILCINVIKGLVQALLKSDPNLVPAHPDRTDTTIFVIIKKDKAKHPAYLNSLELLGQKDDFNMDDPDQLRIYFTKSILDKYPATRYMLFTWDHGNGYAIFRRATQNAGQLSTNRASGYLDILPAAGIVPLHNVLTMDELAKTIKLSFGDKKIDLMVMLNCNMQSFDAGYALRHTVRYLVAPQSNMDFSGYNYTLFFRRVVKDPDESAKNLARCLVTSFSTRLYNPPIDGIVPRSTTALSANDLSTYSSLANCFDQLTSSLKINFSQIKPEIVMARAVTFPVNDLTHSVDFIHLLQNLRKTLGIKWEPKLVNRILSLHKKAIVEIYIGSYYSGKEETPSPSGFSVFFPLALGQTIGSDTLTIFKEDSFTKEREWNTFVLKFAKDP